MSAFFRHTNWKKKILMIWISFYALTKAGRIFYHFHFLTLISSYNMIWGFTKTIWQQPRFPPSPKRTNALSLNLKIFFPKQQWDKNKNRIPSLPPLTDNIKEFYLKFLKHNKTFDISFSIPINSKKKKNGEVNSSFHAL